MAKAPTKKEANSATEEDVAVEPLHSFGGGGLKHASTVQGATAQKMVSAVTRMTPTAATEISEKIFWMVQSG